jgi:hypothetical protein
LAKKFTSIGKVTRAIQKSILSANKNALSKAVTSTKNKTIADLKTDTGLRSELIKNRVMELKPTKDKFKGSVWIATKNRVQLSEFKPSEKKLKTEVVNAYGTQGRIKKPFKRTHYGATIKIGKQPRTFIAGAFVRKGKSSGKLLVLGHKVTMDRNNTYTRSTGVHRKQGWSRTPMSTAFIDAARARKKELAQHLLKTFKMLHDEDLAKTLGKNLK